MNNTQDKKTVLILGGTGDIGKSVAVSLKKNGFVVRAHGLKGNYAADLRKDKDIKKIIDKIIKENGKIDIVVNSVSAPININKIQYKSWDNYCSHFNVQLKSIIESVNYLAENMVNKNYGHFINICSSVVNGRPPKGYSDYIVSKYSVLGLSKCLSEELNVRGVFVDCVSPDFIKSRLTKTFPAKIEDILISKNRTGKLTTPNDVAEVVLNLINNPKKKFRHILLSGGEVIKKNNDQ